MKKGTKLPQRAHVQFIEVRDAAKDAFLLDPNIHPGRRYVKTHVCCVSVACLYCGQPAGHPCLGEKGATLSWAHVQRGDVYYSRVEAEASAMRIKTKAKPAWRTRAS